MRDRNRKVERKRVRALRPNERYCAKRGVGRREGKNSRAKGEEGINACFDFLNRSPRDFISAPCLSRPLSCFARHSTVSCSL